ncbi:hypothetical protein BDD12DRAFT_888850 [Trichophaea hybrida]|nr:hypothetical protein BDD12DRAFT_888850 [Trichophaea hybrida]
MPSTDFTSLLSSLPPAPLQNRPPHNPALSDNITSLQLHPALESVLHILNADLASAHFLVRHMQSAPAFEGMYLHGILHRIEGDIPNARAWYSDVADSDVFREIWGGGNRWEVFLGAIEALRRGEGEKDGLRERGEEEVRKVLEWCVDKFGTDRMVDASSMWVRPSEKIKSMGEGQVTGDQQRGVF